MKFSEGKLEKYCLHLKIFTQHLLALKMFRGPSEVQAPRKHCEKQYSLLALLQLVAVQSAANVEANAYEDFNGVYVESDLMQIAPTGSENTSKKISNSHSKSEAAL